MNKFWEDQRCRLLRYCFDQWFEKKRIQSNWHNTTFKKVSDHIKNEVHLDYACGPVLLQEFIQTQSLFV